MRLLADAHISPRTVAALRVAGHDVVRVGSDVLAPDAADADIVAAAIADARVIVSHDVDFSAIVALSGLDRPSVVLLRLGSASVGLVTELLERALPLVTSDLQAGALVTVDEQQIRVRRLPVR